MAADLPPGYMSEEESGAILAKTLHIHLAPDLSGLSDVEREVITRLIEVGQIFQRLHEDMRHHQALLAHQELLELDRRLGSPVATQNLLTLYYLAKGPTIRGLDNRRRPFLPVDDHVPGRDVYPWGVEREEIDAYLEHNPGERARILDLRSVVRRTDRDALERDLDTLQRYPVLDVLHPGLRTRLESMRDDPGDRVFYALPYSVAYADSLMVAYKILFETAELIEEEDADYADYLRNRARDILSDDYESGDASWVTGRFHNLNSAIGSYEVYDDQLYGVKSFFSLNVLLRDRAKSDELGEAIRGLQAFENSLPYEPVGWDGKTDKKRVRANIPIGVYNVVADFAQSRGRNTATILPNESEHARKYGRTILLRNNIMSDTDLFGVRQDAYTAAVSEEFADLLTSEGGFYRTLWHEIGHYLGVDRTRDGSDLVEALKTYASVCEELKADLVSLYLTVPLEQSGYYTKDKRRAVYADGIRRVLRKNKPQLSQPYGTMQLMQFNYFLDRGLLVFDKKAGRLHIDFDRYPETVESMLREVLAIQYEGDPGKTRAFIDRWFAWEEDLHAVIAASMKSAERYRYAYVTYEALAPGGASGGK